MGKSARRMNNLPLIINRSNKRRTDEEEAVKSNYAYTLRGIKNETGICYLNAALQCLLAVEAMREKFGKPNRDFKFDKQCNSFIAPFKPKLDGRLTYHLKKLFSQRCDLSEPTSIKPSTSDPIFEILHEHSPEKFSDTGSWPGLALYKILILLCREEQARDWDPKMRYGRFEPLLPSRNFEIDHPTPDDLPHTLQTFIRKIFSSYYCFALRCNLCSETTHQFVGPSLTLTIPDVTEDAEQSEQRYSVADLLVHCGLDWVTDLHRRKKCSRELDSEPNDIAYEPSVKFLFRNAPPVLIFRLIVPSEEESGYRFKKIKIEETLDLMEFVHPAFADGTGSCKYKLAAFVPLLGIVSQKNFHGLAFVRHSKYPTENIDPKSWYAIDDARDVRFEELEDLQYTEEFLHSDIK